MCVCTEQCVDGCMCVVKCACRKMCRIVWCGVCELNRVCVDLNSAWECGVNRFCGVCELNSMCVCVCVKKPKTGRNLNKCLKNFDAITESRHCRILVV